MVMHIRHEMELHLAECEELGISKAEIERHEESQGENSSRFFGSQNPCANIVKACTAYSRYVLDIGQSEDWLALQIALLPCLLGYGLIAKRLKALQRTDPHSRHNRYLKWIENYVAEDYTEAVKKGCGTLRYRRIIFGNIDIDIASVERHACNQAPARIEELVKIFIHATKVSQEEPRDTTC